jgi:hypothetical protein
VEGLAYTLRYAAAGLLYIYWVLGKSCQDRLHFPRPLNIFFNLSIRANIVDFYIDKYNAVQFIVEVVEAAQKSQRQIHPPRM